MSLDPTVVQVKPTATDDSTDVGHAVVQYLSRPILADNLTSAYVYNKPLIQVAQDHESRIAFGEKKYGQRLKINNGRDAIMDSYQELLDFLSYAMQAHLEGKEGFIELFDEVANIAALVRERLSIKVDDMEAILTEDHPVPMRLFDLNVNANPKE